MMSAERPLRERHRLRVRVHGVRLPFQPGEPTVGPLVEADRHVRDERAVVFGRLPLRQRPLRDLSVLADPLPVELAAVTDDDVVRGTADTGAAVRSVRERSPWLAGRADARVPCLERCRCGALIPFCPEWHSISTYPP
jgi:hypothetical protein